MLPMTWAVVRENLGDQERVIFDVVSTREGFLPENPGTVWNAELIRSRFAALQSGAPESPVDPTVSKALLLFDQAELHRLTDPQFMQWQARVLDVRERLEALHTLTALPPVLTSESLEKVQEHLHELTRGPDAHFVVPWLGIELWQLRQRFATHNKSHPAGGTSGGAVLVHQRGDRHGQHHGHVFRNREEEVAHYGVDTFTGIDACVEDALVFGME